MLLADSTASLTVVPPPPVPAASVPGTETNGRRHQTTEDICGVGAADCAVAWDTRRV